ncbi:hypothetical protein DIPPA_35572 [Diplonema papillatum]|nr:hypothetical protein DIPPA_35572 [Diplonema papillatum]
MGLSYDEVESLRQKYPDRLQTQSKIADIDYEKTWMVKLYAIGGMWALCGLFPLTSMMILAGLRKGSHYDASKSLFAPSMRRRTFKHSANTVLGFLLAYVTLQRYNYLESQAAGIWAIQATHVGNFKPKGNRFLERHFPEEEVAKYSTVEQRAHALRMWQDDNVMT